MIQYLGKILYVITYMLNVIIARGVRYDGAELADVHNGPPDRGGVVMKYRLSRTRYCASGSMTVEVEMDETELVHAVENSKAGMEGMAQIEEIERQLDQFEDAKRQAFARKLEEDPQMRLEYLQGKKLELEEALRAIAGEIMKEEENLGQGR